MTTPSSDPSAAGSHIPVGVGRPASEETLRLVALFDELEKGQIAFLDESAKRIIELCTALLGVLTGLAAFGKDFPPPYLKDNTALIVVGILALACYVLALLGAVISVQPRTYKHFRNNITRLREELDRMVAFKIFFYRVSTFLLVLGSLGLAVLLGATLLSALPPTP